MPATSAPGAQERIVWLLRTNRRYGAGHRDVRRASFAAALGPPLATAGVAVWSIARDRSWLSRISQDPDMPAEARTAARWWSGREGHH